MTEENKLTEKQKRFVALYAGNGTEAARAAGYEGSDATLAQVAYENLRKPEIAQAIAARTSRALAPKIASRQDRQSFWTDVMNDVSAEMKDRLRAAELLGKSEGDFVIKVEHGMNAELAEKLTAARQRVVNAIVSPAAEGGADE